MNSIAWVYRFVIFGLGFLAIGIALIARMELRFNWGVAVPLMNVAAMYFLVAGGPSWAWKHYVRLRARREARRRDEECREEVK